MLTHRTTVVGDADITVIVLPGPITVGALCMATNVVVMVDPGAVVVTIE